jgi:hypothetical protein
MAQQEGPIVHTAASADLAQRRRQRFAKGRRPFFMADPDVDRLLAIVTALTAEVSVIRERLDTAERLADRGMPATPANIEAYEPEPAVETARETVRAAMLERVFRILSQPNEAEDGSYEATIDRFS